MNMTEHRNIAELARNSHSIRYEEVGYVSGEVVAAINRMYPTKIDTRLKFRDSRKGSWSFHQRMPMPHFLEGERDEDVFCAVYEKDGKPRTLFMGALDDLAYAGFTADELSNRVLEQRRWFAWPPRKLT